MDGLGTIYREHYADEMGVFLAAKAENAETGVR